jgi:copper chaperone
MSQMSSRLFGDDHQGYNILRAGGPSRPRAAGRDTITIVSTRSIVVNGMTCDHCASAVRAEIGKLPGVVDVDVDVAAGTVRITGDPLPGDTSLREAIEEAGYEFAD